MTQQQGEPAETEERGEDYGSVYCRTAQEQGERGGERQESECHTQDHRRSLTCLVVVEPARKLRSMRLTLLSGLMHVRELLLCTPTVLFPRVGAG